jgi:hypothetical protein
MDKAAWPLVGDIAETTSVRNDPRGPFRMPCVLFVSGALFYLSVASFSTPANSTHGKRSGAREPAGDQAADANLSRRIPPTAFDNQLLHFISRVYCGKATPESERTGPKNNYKIYFYMQKKILHTITYDKFWFFVCTGHMYLS